MDGTRETIKLIEQAVRDLKIDSGEWSYRRNTTKWEIYGKEANKKGGIQGG